jgi:hypothetical protein
MPTTLNRFSQSTPGPADHAEPFQPERIGDRLHILDSVNNPAADAAVGTGIPGPVIGDQADAEPMEDNPARPRAVSATGCAMQKEYRQAVGIAQTVC